MADDRMKNDDLRNVGDKGQGQDYGKGQGQGQQTPGRNPQGGQQQGQPGGQRGLDDEDQDLNTGKQSGTQNRGGQNR